MGSEPYTYTNRTHRALAYGVYISIALMLVSGITAFGLYVLFPPIEIEPQAPLIIFEPEFDPITGDLMEIPPLPLSNQYGPLVIDIFSASAIIFAICVLTLVFGFGPGARWLAAVRNEA